MKPHESPISEQELQERIARLPDRRLVLARCQYTPAAGVRRLLGFALKEDRLAARLDVWVRTERELSDLPVIHARCDAMYATSPALLWYTDADCFHLYATTRTRGELVRTHLFRRGESFEAVHGFIANDWVQRGVAVYEAGGHNRRVIAEASEPMAMADPTYDAMDVMGDGAWVGSLGRDLAGFLAVPLRLDDVLR